MKTCHDCLHEEACRNIIEKMNPAYKNKKITLKSKCSRFEEKTAYINIEEAAELASKIYTNPCDSIYTEEYLPYVCDHKHTCSCSNIECWKQYFTHYMGKIE